MLIPSKIVQIVKSITAKEIFRRAPAVKKQLWGGAFWSSGFYINTVGQHGNETTIREYIANQGKLDEYEKLHRQPLVIEKISAQQLELF